MKKEHKEIQEQFKQHQNDTGSSEVQIVALTDKIKQLIEHGKINKKDYSSKLGLIKKVSQRRKLIAYLKRTNQTVYTNLLSKIGLKK
jgi:small subunit ribosomal protein S15